MSDNRLPSAVDNAFFQLIREAVESLHRRAALDANGGESVRVLDIAPQDHAGIRPYLDPHVELVTLDLDAAAKPDVIGDICDLRGVIDNDEFDLIMCTEVLEHVANPFAAIAELQRVLKPTGRLYASSPFDFRIHGPLPDNWRFTEHGWRELLKNFSSIELISMENPDRFLMPIHYSVVAVN